MQKSWSFDFRILVKKQDDLWIAHCLELDLVVAALTENQVEEDILAVIKEQVRYCIVNDNMDYLFRSAPKEVWDEYQRCEKNMKPYDRVVEAHPKGSASADFPLISFTTSACHA